MPPTGSSLSVQPVVLAGGASTRFDRGNKAFARLGDRSLLGHVVTTVAAAVDARPVIAVRDDAQRRTIQTEVTDHLGADPAFVTDDPAFEGPLAAVFAACAWTDRRWLFLVGCDMPLLDGAVVSWLLDRARESGADAIVPRTDGGIEPLHALYRRDAVAAVRDRVGSQAGFHSLLDQLDEVTVVPHAESPRGLARSVQNVNTVADLERLRRQLEETASGE
jgi:molybdopterin-guanine dinucleotide biosynthesis protein A